MEGDYRELFFSEAQEYLKEINKALVQLEKDPQDYEAINLVFRLMHTLKGMAASMEYKDLASLAHRMEDFFDALRSKRINLTPEVMDIIFEEVDAFATIIEDLKEDKALSVDVAWCISKLDQIIPTQKKPQPLSERQAIKLDKEFLKKLKAQNKSIFQITVHLTEGCAMKGVRAFLVVTRAKNMGEVVKVIPSEEELKEEKFERSFEFVLVTREKKEKIKKELEKILEIEKIIVNDFEENSIEKLEERKPSAASTHFRRIQSMRIPVERLDKIMNLMGELAILKSRLVQTVHTRDYTHLEEIVYLMERLVSSLQDETLKMRLLPISYILNNFPRIVRDLARRRKKEVDLEMEGGEIELDRVILDEMGDLLVHLVRNAIDHGVEYPEERVKLGKNPRGKISIRVFREKGHIIIEIADDGRGIDFDKVAKSAIKRGLLTSEEANRLEEKKFLDILTTPGFSTKEEADDISGRGVGLDVVKNKLDSLGGRLELESKLGKGTKFILTLPLTLAIIKAMMVRVGEQVYAIPLMNIRETVKIETSGIKSIKDMEMIRLREEIIPLFRLDKELGITSFSKSNGELSVVVVEGRTKTLGLVVDKVIGEQDVVVKSLGSFIKGIRGIAGATILGDGRVALILDVVNLI